ncbi:LuxR C-terminal-related transcriptional regulator [Streptomyces sp. DSM 3412]|uniref:LuxR C-terminal-related transcriptional regulator n=1 Tax=Streptomyces gottesmaniae TaxID=3075518 RepID=A0ABU2ZBV9_9ACTN|nr:LuxR C-terminal-related transcriptional regulator [Streptomyces sp. DSM 3412]MDT0573089.1 LuxR C-terminal-related transcriptional regulator [Streptomyces sp. DSM 3412]
MTSEVHGHRTDELCAVGTELYARALRDGRVRDVDASAAPCLIQAGLLHPAVGDPGWLEATGPATALHRLLRGIEDRVAEERRREEQLAAAFEPLLRIAERRTAPADSITTAIALLGGIEQINAAITGAMAEATRELLCIQPHTHQHGTRGLEGQTASLGRDQDLLARGARIRTLYPHTLRHSPLIRARYEQLRGDAQARTLDEVTDRLILVDRTVAFIPADAERTLALEIRHPTLISFLATTFDRLWHLATPMYPDAVHLPVIDGITPRQRAIARLLVEGHTDTSIADRLGLNVRTARLHIAKLAAQLGSESRAQLGYLIGQSGILEQEP